MPDDMRPAGAGEGRPQETRGEPGLGAGGIGRTEETGNIDVPDAPSSSEEPTAEPTGEPTASKEKKKKKKKKKKKGGSARGVETMYRTSYRTHLDLSALADNKANIMISINGIIISILLGTNVGALGQVEAGIQAAFLRPTAVLLFFCLLSLVWAVLAARPRVTRRATTLEEVRTGKANILFFGNFTSLPEEDFVEGMDELVKDPARTYTNMTRDIYGLGSVLETKYRLLRVSYTLFMIGLILGVGLFLAEFVRTAIGMGSTTF